MAVEVREVRLSAGLLPDRAGHTEAVAARWSGDATIVLVGK